LDKSLKGEAKILKALRSLIMIIIIKCNKIYFKTFIIIAEASVAFVNNN
jgi:hypothetical protein